jgi:hypothetical protein
MLANELDLAVLDAAPGVALTVRLEVAEIADVAVAVAGGAVLFAEGVDFSKSSVTNDRTRIITGTKTTSGTSNNSSKSINNSNTGELRKQMNGVDI